MSKTLATRRRRIRERPLREREMRKKKKKKQTEKKKKVTCSNWRLMDAWGRMRV